MKTMVLRPASTKRVKKCRKNQLQEIPHHDEAAHTKKQLSVTVSLPTLWLKN